MSFPPIEPSSHASNCSGLKITGMLSWTSATNEFVSVISPEEALQVLQSQRNPLTDMRAKVLSFTAKPLTALRHAELPKLHTRVRFPSPARASSSPGDVDAESHWRCADRRGFLRHLTRAGADLDRVPARGRWLLDRAAGRMEAEHGRGQD